GTPDVAATFDPGVRLAGDGTGLFALAWMNDRTGQIDALLPLGTTLDPGSCVDTAVVGSPFAFHLDANGGEMLLLRVEEDAVDPHIELRDARGGVVWTAGIGVPVAPP